MAPKMRNARKPWRPNFKTIFFLNISIHNKIYFINFFSYFHIINKLYIFFYYHEYIYLKHCVEVIYMCNFVLIYLFIIKKITYNIIFSYFYIINKYISYKINKCLKKLWNEKNLNIHIFFLLIRSPWLLLLLLNSSGWLVQARKFTVHYLAQGWSVNLPNSNIWENLHWWVRMRLSLKTK